MLRGRRDRAASLAGLLAEFYVSIVVRLVEARLLSSAGQCGRDDRSRVSLRFVRLKPVERKIRLPVLHHLCTDRRLWEHSVAGLPPSFRLTHMVPEHAPGRAATGATAPAVDGGTEAFRIGQWQE